MLAMQASYLANITTVVLKLFDRKYLIIKFKVKYFRGCMISSKIFYLEYSYIASDNRSCYSGDAIDRGKIINTNSCYTMATPYHI